MRPALDRWPLGAWALAATGLLGWAVATAASAAGAEVDGRALMACRLAVFAAAAALCWGSRSATRTSRTGWRLFAAAMASSAAADGAAVLRPDDLVAGSLAGVAYLSWFPVVLLATVLLLRGGGRAFHGSTALDGVLAAAAAVSVAWCFLLDPMVVGRSAASPADAGAVLVLPVLQLVVLGLLAGSVAVLHHVMDRVVVAVVLAFAAGAASDIALLVRLADTGAYAPSVMDGGWLAQVLLLAWAAREHPRERLPRRGTSIAPAVPVLGTGAALTVLLSAQVVPVDDGAAVMAAVALVAAALRAAQTVREVRALTGSAEQARTDELTGLPNRRALLEECDRLLRGGSAEGAALVLLDLDRFKAVNDALGHPAGDQLLRATAAALSAALRPGELLARLGGDEFAVLVPATGTGGAPSAADHLLAALRTPVPLGDLEVLVQGSAGVAVVPPGGTTTTELLRRADVAMYAAKSEGGGAHVAGEEDLPTHDSLQLAQEVRLALVRGEVRVHLQVQRAVDGSGRVTGVEALARWQHPTRGLLPPGAFLPAVEAAGASSALTDVVLEQALAAARTWWDAGSRVAVAVNLAPADVLDARLPTRVALALTSAGLPGGALVLEITEDTVMDEADRARTALLALRGLGVGLALDDFGTGRSSLVHLRDMPLTELKLDRGFLDGIATDHRAQAVVRAAVGLAHAVDLPLVAEGVEDQGSLRALAACGCDAAQGYLLGRPAPADDVVALVVAEHRAAVRDLTGAAAPS